MGIIDDLLAHPGLYIGIDTVMNTERRGAARMTVTPLPGRAGVTLDYEILNPAMPDRVRGHVERTVLGRTHDGNAVMCIADDHAGSIAILRETDPGTFEPAEPVPYPMKVVLSMPQAGHIRHAWWYGAPGDEAVERDVSELTKIG